MPLVNITGQPVRLKKNINAGNGTTYKSYYSNRSLLRGNPTNLSVSINYTQRVDSGVCVGSSCQPLGC